MSPPDFILHSVLVRRFTLPIELRSMIIEHYFPFLPDETNVLTAKELLTCSKQPFLLRTYNHIVDKRKVFALHFRKNIELYGNNVPTDSNIIFVTVHLGRFIYYGGKPDLFISNGVLIHDPQDKTALTLEINAADITEENVHEKFRLITKFYRRSLTTVFYDCNRCNFFLW